MAKIPPLTDQGTDINLLNSVDEINSTTLTDRSFGQKGNVLYHALGTPPINDFKLCQGSSGYH
jgi:hypothetical protein